MKITKTNELYLKNKASKEAANKGCNICPFCGYEKNVFLTHSREWYEGTGLFGLKKGSKWKVDKHTCSQCEAEWESEPYRVYE